MSYARQPVDRVVVRGGKPRVGYREERVVQLVLPAQDGVRDALAAEVEVYQRPPVSTVAHPAQ